MKLLIPNLICNRYLPLFIFLILGGCRDNAYRLQPISVPCQKGGMSNLHISTDGQAFISWIEFLDDSTDVLAFATLQPDLQWSAPKIIARHDNWFVNWADFPSLVSFSNQNQQLAAHWLQKNAAGTYDYDIWVALSENGGQHWNPPFRLHDDGVAAEHGFVSLLPVDNQIFATWLDGRYTKTENSSDGHDHTGQEGAMTLRAAFFDKNGTISNETELDDRVCDCCNTAATLTADGIIVVAYRDRSPAEIRDISIVRYVDTRWTPPQVVSNDNWEIAGCPVNGPKIEANGNMLGVAWYTMAKDTAKVKVAFSKDSGANFEKPIRIDEGQPLGRIGLTWLGESLVVSWLEQADDQKAEIRLAKISPDGKILQRITATRTSSSRDSGFPVLKNYNGQLLLTWTGVKKDETTTVKSILIRGLTK